MKDRLQPLVWSSSRDASCIKKSQSFMYRDMGATANVLDAR